MIIEHIELIGGPGDGACVDETDVEPLTYWEHKHQYGIAIYTRDFTMWDSLKRAAILLQNKTPEGRMHYVGERRHIERRSRRGVSNSE